MPATVRLKMQCGKRVVHTIWIGRSEISPRCTQRLASLIRNAAWFADLHDVLARLHRDDGCRRQEPWHGTLLRHPHRLRRRHGILTHIASSSRAHRLLNECLSLIHIVSCQMLSAISSSTLSTLLRFLYAHRSLFISLMRFVGCRLLSAISTLTLGTALIRDLGMLKSFHARLSSWQDLCTYMRTTTMLR